MDFKKLYSNINVYNLLCRGTIKSDMAKRIMYSILPALSDAAEIYNTHGVVDFKALKAAAEGRKDVINYGMAACKRELQHYQGKLDPRQKNLLNYKNKTEINLDMAKEYIEMFQDLPNWVQSYGGANWAKIAKSLYKLISYDIELKKLDKQDPDYYLKETEILKQIVVELNVFDGLAHNTASILENLLEQEVKLYEDEIQTNINERDRREQEFSKEDEAVKHMMDIKELDNPIEVYKDIEKELSDSGELSRFKDHIEKIRRHPDYKKENKSKIVQLYKIRVRKRLQQLISGLNQICETCEEAADTLMSLKNQDEIDEQVPILIGKIRGISSMIIGLSMTGLVNLINGIFTVPEKMKEYLDTYLSINDLSKVLKDNSNKLSVEIINSYRYISRYLGPDFYGRSFPRDEVVFNINDLKNKCKTLVMYLQSI